MIRWERRHSSLILFIYLFIYLFFFAGCDTKCFNFFYIFIFFAECDTKCFNFLVFYLFIYFLQDAIRNVFLRPLLTGGRWGSCTTTRVPILLLIISSRWVPCSWWVEGLIWLNEVLPRTTVSQDVQTWFSVQLAFAKFVSKIKRKL